MRGQRNFMKVLSNSKARLLVLPSSVSKVRLKGFTGFLTGGGGGGRLSSLPTSRLLLLGIKYHRKGYSRTPAITPLPGLQKPVSICATNKHQEPNWRLSCSCFFHHGLPPNPKGWPLRQLQSLGTPDPPVFNSQLAATDNPFLLASLNTSPVFPSAMPAKYRVSDTHTWEFSPNI